MTRTVAALALALFAGVAASQTWPSRPVHIVVGIPPGGMADALPRKMQDALAAALGQPVVVENRPGGAGSIAVLAVTQAKDNHTFGILTLQNAALPALDPKAAYDIRKDLQGVVLIATVPNILAVTQGMPLKNAAEFMAYAKANPGKVRLATAGNGTGAHFALETPKVGGGLDIVHVPYRGVQASYVDVIAGHVDATIAPYASMRPHLQAGTLRPLAVSTTTASPLVPNLPTLVEVHQGSRLDRLVRGGGARLDAGRVRRQDEPGAARQHEDAAGGRVHDDEWTSAQSDAGQADDGLHP
jgi:tripartite-type tricarboxylate transporter receptor subunit TctC